MILAAISQHSNYIEISIKRSQFQQCIKKTMALMNMNFLTKVISTTTLRIPKHDIHSHPLNPSVPRESWSWMVRDAEVGYPDYGSY